MVIFEKRIVNIILNDKRLNAFLPRSGTRQECMLSPILFKIILEFKSVQKDKKKNKRHSD